MQIFRLNAGPGGNFLHRNSSAIAVCKPGLTLVETAAVLLCHGLIVGRSRSKGARHRVGHNFQ